jgi:uncharacterized phiE125 gp8 family phage protein
MTSPKQSLAIIDSSTVEPVSLQLLRQHCRVVASDEDELLRSYLKAARELVESESGLTLVRKTARELRSDWPCHRVLELTAWPIISVTSVKYLDGLEQEQTLDPSTQYRSSTLGRPAYLSLAPTASWPSVVLDRADAIRIEYECGYDQATKPAPEPACQAILLLAAHYYRNREAAVIGTINSELELGIDRLIDQLKDHRYP